MYQSRSALLIPSIMCAACSGNPTPKPADASQFQVGVAKGAQRNATRDLDDATSDRADSKNSRAREQLDTNGTGGNAGHIHKSTLQRQPALQVRPDNDEQARAAFTAATGYDLRGQAEFTKVAQGVEVRVAINGAPPGFKGVHIHKKPDCSDIPTGLGAQLPPNDVGHGYPAATEHHLGDLGNIRIGADGAGELKIVVPAANLKDADENSFLTRSIVVHEVSDTGDQAGGAGAPIACGIIDR